MGFWNLLKGNAEGIREAMRMSFDKHLKKAKSGELAAVGTTPFEIALYGALATRYQSRGQSQGEPILWAELAPFLGLRESDARDYLAEYVVYCERPNEANVDALRRKVNEGIGRLDKDRKMAASMGALHGVRWSDLLDKSVRQSLNSCLE